LFHPQQWLHVELEQKQSKQASKQASKHARKQAMDECTLQMDFVSRPVMRDASAWLPVGPGRAATDSARHSGSSVSSSSGLSGAYGDMMQHKHTRCRQARFTGGRPMGVGIISVGLAVKSLSV
jgi:hypothetical protein